MIAKKKTKNLKYFKLYFLLLYYRVKKLLLIWWQNIEPLRRLARGLYYHFRRQKYFWPTIFIVLLFITLPIYYQLSKNKQDHDLSGEGRQIIADKNNISNSKEVAADPFLRMSRLTFFLKNKIKGSLAVPEIWEGKFRTRETGNEFLLLYIGNPEQESPIISFKTYPQAEWDKIKPEAIEEVELEVASDQVFTYKIFQENISTGAKSQEFNLMLGQLSKIIETFKTIKL